MDHLDTLRHQPPVFDRPVVLYDDGGHAVYWVGSQEDSPFRCNAYLIVNGATRVLFDPGSSLHHFAQVRDRVGAIIPPESVTHIVLHHQDPDLCDSLPDWIALCPDVTLVTTPRARVLLPYYGFSPDVRWLDISPNDTTALELGDCEILFMTAPFLHFPEACTSFDTRTGFLLSGDIGAAIERDWRLVVDDFESHWKAMVPFHVFYMASNRALRGFTDKLRHFPIQAILPQHGSILPRDLVAPTLAALRELPCGVDLLYPDSNLENALRGMRR